MKMGNRYQARILRILAIVFFGSVFAQSLFSQGWYNPYWQYRAPITISNPGVALTDFQVNVILDNSFAWSNTQPGGIDIRFTAADGTTLIDFWIESWEMGTSASLWVKVPSVPAASTTSVYMYYGNDEALSASNGYNTFEFFDDFEQSNQIDLTRWSAEGGTWSVAENSLQQDGTYGRVARGITTARQILKSSFSGEDYIVECYGLQHLGNTWGLGARTTNATNGYSLNLYSNHNTDGQDNLWWYRWWSSPGTNLGIWHTHLGDIYRDQWYKLKVVAYGSSYDFYFNDVLQGTATESTWLSGAVTLYGEVGTDALFNDIRVRKFAENEPSFELGIEEANPNPPLNISYTKADVSCFGSNDGAIDITVTGGSGNYTYLWTPGGFTEQDLSNLSAGTYTVTVEDNESESIGMVSVTITEPSPLIVNYAVTSPLLCNTGTASVEITASGGTPPYTGAGVFEQPEGTTVYNIIDNNGCNNSISVTISAADSWFNPAWKYRKQVDVPNTAGTDLLQFQVKIALGGTFDFDKAKNDGSDIRFTSADGESPLPYWIENWSSTADTATLWVKVPSIPVTGTIVYMYYGNDAAESVSNGDDTFEFFDDFEFSEQQEGYWEFGPSSTIMVRDQAWETSAPHNLSAVKAPDGADYTYFGYYGPQGSGWIAMAGSNDLQNWTKFTSTVNPLFSGHGERWPSVIRVDGVYYMVHTMGYGSPSYLVYRSSNDGFTWSEPTTIIQDLSNNQNPSLFHDPVSGRIYLYWFRREGDRLIMAREAETVAGLVTAPNIELLRSSTTLAAPNVLYYNGTYFLSTEIYPDNEWQVRIYSGATPTGPFTMLPGNPALVGGCACLFQHLIDDTIYEYYCKLTGSTWTLDMRIIDPSEGRVVFDQAILDDGKWTPEGGTWDVMEATQQDGTVGYVAQGATTSNQILRSSFSGTDYVLEGNGRQISDRIWGLGFRTTDAANGYTLNLYEDLDSENNLHFYRWPSGGTGDLWNTGVGPVNMNEWHKLSIKAHSNEFDIYFNDQFQATVTDDTYATGAVALYGEEGVTAQFNDIRVRKYASADPLTSLNIVEEIWSPSHQWLGAVNDDWNNSQNWCGGVPDNGTDVLISSEVPNQPRLTSTASPSQCNNLLISDNSNIIIEAGTALTVGGSLVMGNNGQLIIGSTLASSGSLIVSGTTTGNITFNRQLKPGTDPASDWHLAAPPVATNADVNTGKVSTAYEWSEPAGSWTTKGITAVLPGYGYNIRQEEASDGVITFTGPVVSSDLTVAASSPYADAIAPDESYFDRTYVAGRSLEDLGGRGWNLLGNPYPSAINASAFINANYNATPSLSQFDPNYVALYLFDGTARRYYYIANSTGWPSGVELSGTHIQAGQGFFVLAMNDNSEFTFTRAMQEHSTATAMLKSGETDDRWPGVQLKVAHTAGEVITTVVYSNEMTTGVDPGYDVGLFKSGQDVELYTILPAGDNGINYTRQALPLSVADTIIVPVGVDTEDGGEVVFSAATVPAGTNKFWLEDRTTGTYTDLSSATYTVTLPAKSYGTGRFYIVASANTPTDVNFPEQDAGLRIWSSFGKIIIKGPVTSGSVCELFDLQGNRILKTRLTDGELNTVSLPAGMGGVCLVRVADGVKVTSKKVVVL